LMVLGPLVIIFLQRIVGSVSYDEL
jgi:hypothetical protein